MEKNYVYFSGNKKNISKLEGWVPNPRHAIVLDQFAFLSLNSNFILFDRPKENGWFCVEYKNLATMTGYKERSIKRIVKAFEELGLIEKIRKLVNNSCRSCIRITEKTKAVLGLNEACGQESTIKVRKVERQSKTATDQKKLSPVGTFENANLAHAYNEEKKEKENFNNITRSKRDEKTPYNLPNEIKALFERIGERLTSEQKAIIFAAFRNLQAQTNIKISSPKEFIAWICFSILNAKYQLPRKETFQEKLNTLMKIARSPSGLKKPRGFHNHWDIGQEMRNYDAEKRKKYESEKLPDDSRQKGGISLNDFTPIKAKEIWDQSIPLKHLKSKRADLVKDLSALISENKAIPILYQSSPAFLDNQLRRNRFLIDEKKEALKMLNKEISVAEASQQESKNMQWEGLYEAG